ncbi:MAG: cytochrome P450 [Gammaproteobacteria bacterium]|nr:cytochrome P450 [Gammaproteobacteria bacterium]
MTALPMDTNLVDPDLIPGLQGPPHTLFDAWRQSDPVHWNPPNENYRSPLPDGRLDRGFWVLTRYQDLYDVSRNQDLFSSHDGGPIIWDLEGDALKRQQVNLMGMQKRQHLAMKRLLLPPFAPRQLAAFEPEIKQVAKEIVDAVAPRGECEFVFDVASRLPVYTFCKLMGIPDEMREQVLRLGNMAADTESQVEGEQPALYQLFAISDALSAEKREQPDASLLSSLIHNEVDGEKLDQLSINMFFVTMSIAGHETTRGTAVHFIRLMREHPEQYELLRSDLDKYLPNAIDEVLRHSPPVIKFRRTVTADTEIGGQPVSKGDKVYLSYPAANRDPAVFDDPHRFDITRANANKHLSFGTGPHVCLGARLAHMQLKALLTEIVTRTPDIHPAGERAMLRSIWFNAIVRMPVAFTPEPRH